MARRVNPLIFRLGTTYLWRSQYSLSNYTSHLRNYIIFKSYLNSKLNILNRLFSTNFSCFLSKIKLYLKPFFISKFTFKLTKYKYINRKLIANYSYKLNSKVIAYTISTAFGLSKYIQYIFYKFSYLTHQTPKLRVFYLLVYKFVSIFYLSNKTRFSKNNLLNYFLIYCGLKEYFDYWVHFLSGQHYFNKSIRPLRGYQKRYSAPKKLKKSFKKGKKHMHNMASKKYKINSLNSKRSKGISFKNFYKFSKNYYFMKKQDTLFFNKYLKSHVYERFFYLKKYLFKTISRIFDYFYFIQYIYSRILLRYYLAKSIKNKYIEYSFFSLYHFSKNFSKLFYNLPAVIRRSFHAYKVNESNKRKILYIFALSLIFHDVETFNVLLSYLLPRNKNQFAVLRLFGFIMEMFKFFHFNFISLIVKISGKFSGKFVNHKPKTKTMTSVYGRPGIPLQDISIVCRYSEKQINTKKGIFGLKVWFYLKN